MLLKNRRKEKEGKEKQSCHLITGLQRLNCQEQNKNNSCKINDKLGRVCNATPHYDHCFSNVLVQGNLKIKVDLQQDFRLFALLLSNKIKTENLLKFDRGPLSNVILFCNSIYHIGCTYLYSISDMNYVL